MTKRIGFLFSSNISIHQGHRGKMLMFHFQTADGSAVRTEVTEVRKAVTICHCLTFVDHSAFTCSWTKSYFYCSLSEQSIMVHHQEQTQPGKAQPCSTDRWDSHSPTTYLGTGEAFLPSFGLFPLSPPHSSAPICTHAPPHVHLQIPSYPPPPLLSTSSLLPASSQGPNNYPVVADEWALGGKKKCQQHLALLPLVLIILVGKPQTHMRCCLHRPSEQTRAVFVHFSFLFG